MNNRLRHLSCPRACVCIVAFVMLFLSPLQATSAAGQQPLTVQDFSQSAPSGFGDFHNSMARASLWWNNQLYVGTSRDFGCAQAAILKLYLPFKPYPPPDPSMNCASDPHDLSMQAEIWRWSPGASVSDAGTWERVYQSQVTTPIPGTSKFVAREVGFRDMAVFTEPDGTEALYVTGITAKGYIPGLPPPTLLRSTDGVNFAPVPQAPGTVLGDLDFVEGITISAFNKITSFNNKLYLVAGGDFGHGILLEASDPAGGNDNFQRISPPGLTLTYMYPFNNALYIAQGAQPVTGNPPYKVLKMDTSTSPYTFTTVVDGTRLPAANTAKSSQSVATMHAVGNALWVATNQPVELVRINPNDTWDLFVGQSRKTVSGTWKYPLTGLGDGFDWYFNIHIHRMQDHDGYLYTSSNDLSNAYPLNEMPSYSAIFASRYGFDVKRTRNGWYFNPVTLTGFTERDPTTDYNSYNFTGRVANSTPYGLFLGTGNNKVGLQMWRGLAGTPHIAAPETLEAEKTSAGTVLSWAPSPSATVYHVYKADFAYWFQLGVPSYAGGTVYPRPFSEIGTTTETNFTDTAPLGVWSQYYVVADDGAGGLSGSSNLTRSPSLNLVTTFNYVQKSLKAWTQNGEQTAATEKQIVAQLTSIKLKVIFRQYAAAQTQLLQLKAASAGLPLAAWRVGDLQVLLDKLNRRIDLARLGKIPAGSVTY